MSEKKHELVIYQSEDGKSRVQIHLVDENAWMTQVQLAELFETSVSNINHHIANIYKDGELTKEATIEYYSIVQTEKGRKVQRKVRFYNLDMILAIGYKVRSIRGVQFRQWASERLKEYIIKGFTLDDARLKGDDAFARYFDELLARIRDIRASERRAYQRVRDIFALASDYVEDQEETHRFFAIMQNKMHYAATSMTAAEIVFRRAKAEERNMGMTNWSGERILKKDVGTAKNYLLENEIDILNRIVVMFLDRAEFRTMQKKDILMGEWEVFLDKFLVDTELPVLKGSGKISHQKAINHAREQYDRFDEQRRLEAEQTADDRYWEDLNRSAEIIDNELKKKKPRKKKDD